MDIVQPDNRRSGGVSEWMEIAAIAAGFGLDAASHGGGATNVHMLLAMPNAIYLESGSLKGEPSTLGRVTNARWLRFRVPELPGMGSELRPEFIRKHKVG